MDLNSTVLLQHKLSVKEKAAIMGIPHEAFAGMNLTDSMHAIGNSYVPGVVGKIILHLLDAALRDDFGIEFPTVTEETMNKSSLAYKRFHAIADGNTPPKKAQLKLGAFFTAKAAKLGA